MPAPCRLAALLVTSLIVPALAHADEPRVASARPLGLLDLEGRSSLGVGLAAGTQLRPQSNVLFGELVLDGELGVGRHLKAFLAVPLGYAHQDQLGGSDSHALAVGGFGYFETGRFTLALGAGEMFGAADSSTLLRHELGPYGADQPILHLFTDVRADVGAGYLQLHADTGLWRYTSGEVGWGGHELVVVSLGGATPLTAFGPRSWLVGELGVAQHFGPSSSGNGEARFHAHVGARWPFGSRNTAALLAGGDVIEDIVTFGVGFELRADFAVL
jgi:hypothetical protein